jgi:hypothetical protein
MALPKLSAQQPIVTSDGKPTSTFLQFMEEARNGQAAVDEGQQALIDALAAAVDAIQQAQAAADAAEDAALAAQDSATAAQGSATAALEAVAEVDLAINNLNDRVTALEA